MRGAWTRGVRRRDERPDPWAAILARDARTWGGRNRFVKLKVSQVSSQDPACGACAPKDSPHHAMHGDGPAAPARPAESRHVGNWTCPMHPQIARDRPGACPICGMALEPMG